MTDRPEFGHDGYRCGGFHLDSWGAGPFVITDETGKRWRFEDSDRFGPVLVKRNGDPLTNPWPGERSPFWRAHRIWARQGRRLDTDNTTCIWTEPKPTTARHIGGRSYEIVDTGEEDGKTIYLGGPMDEHVRARSHRR